MDKQDKVKKPNKDSSKILWLLYALLAVLIVMYAIRNNPAIGAAALITIVVVLVVEFKYSVKSEGIRKSVIDVVVALGAVAIIWGVLIVVLHTSAPIDVVSSCSMLPVLQRGNLVALHGINNVTNFLKEHDVPVVNVTAPQMDSFLSNIRNEFVSYYAYSPSNPSEIATTLTGSQYQIGLYNNKCLNTYSAIGQYNNYYKCRVQNSVQNSNLIQYNYTVGNITINGIGYKEIYTQTVTISNTTITENYSNPIVVYKTNSNDSFSGDIIHRLVAVIRSGNEYYFLTKGDNNPGFDIQFANYPATQAGVIGYYVGGIPIIGYLKLIISGNLEGDAQCNQVIAH